ncbi:hypothetical protein GF345_04250 [Candidatus Woesearchaeota archaeon]|nr:hypothetical protein [Candidatus Woesearchaeota archaeon]
MEPYIPLALTLFFGLTHFFFEKYAHHLKRFDVAFTSFSAGIFLSYIFLSMFPEIVRGMNIVGDGIFFIFFWGFVLLHIAEKYVMQHTPSYRKRMERLTHIRTTGFFVNHFVLGLAVMFFFEIDRPVVAYISLIPIFYHMMSSSILIEHLHKHVRETHLGKFLSSGSVFFGALFALLLDVPLNAYYAMFAFITGILLYIIVRDTLPKYRQGRPTYFLTGVIFYLVLAAIEVILA